MGIDLKLMPLEFKHKMENPVMGDDIVCYDRLEFDRDSRIFKQIGNFYGEEGVVHTEQLPKDRKIAIW